MIGMTVLLVVIVMLSATLLAAHIAQRCCRPDGSGGSTPHKSDVCSPTLEDH